MFTQTYTHILWICVCDRDYESTKLHQGQAHKCSVTPDRCEGCWCWLFLCLRFPSAFVVGIIDGARTPWLQRWGVLFLCFFQMRFHTLKIYNIYTHTLGSLPVQRSSCTVTRLFSEKADCPKGSPPVEEIEALLEKPLCLVVILKAWYKTSVRVCVCVPFIRQVYLPAVS